MPSLRDLFRRSMSTGTAVPGFHISPLTGLGCRMIPFRLFS